MCKLLWWRKPSRVRNFIPHVWQIWGFSPVWILTCSCNPLGVVAMTGHSAHLCIFSFECEYRIWVASDRSNVKLFLQYLHSLFPTNSAPHFELFLSLKYTQSSIVYSLYTIDNIDHVAYLNFSPVISIRCIWFEFSLTNITIKHFQMVLFFVFFNSLNCFTFDQNSDICSERTYHVVYSVYSQFSEICVSFKGTVFTFDCFVNYFLVFL